MVSFPVCCNAQLLLVGLMIRPLNAIYACFIVYTQKKKAVCFIVVVKSCFLDVLVYMLVKEKLLLQKERRLIF